MRKLLNNTKEACSLDNLSHMAKQVATPYRHGDRYEAVSDVFIDGFEIKLGPVSKRAANQYIYVMKNEIQKKT